MKKTRQLPTPPNKAIGRKRLPQQADDESGLLADRMAAAMAEGKLDEFLTQETPNNEYAKNLVSMMMGMTGMMPMSDHITTQASAMQEKRSLPSEEKHSEQGSPILEVPEDVQEAITSGDVKGLKEILRREHLKRTSGTDLGLSEEAVMQPQPSSMPTIDKDLIDALVEIAKDNSVTMDWMILRAIKVYVQEYKKTGRL